MAVTSLFINASSSKGQILKRKTIDDYYFSLQSVLFRIYLPIVIVKNNLTSTSKDICFVTRHVLIKRDRITDHHKISQVLNYFTVSEIHKKRSFSS
jgi:hypothetical protein